MGHRLVVIDALIFLFLSVVKFVVRFVVRTSVLISGIEMTEVATTNF